MSVLSLFRVVLLDHFALRLVARIQNKQSFLLLKHNQNILNFPDVSGIFKIIQKCSRFSVVKQS